jgi:hypothetical protein
MYKHLEAACGDSNQVAIADWTMRDMNQNIHKISQYYAGFEVAASDLDRNPSTLQYALRMVLSEGINQSISYTSAQCNMV